MKKELIVDNNKKNLNKKKSSPKKTNIKKKLSTSDNFKKNVFRWLPWIITSGIIIIIIWALFFRQQAKSLDKFDFELSVSYIYHESDSADSNLKSLSDITFQQQTAGSWLVTAHNMFISSASGVDRDLETNQKGTNGANHNRTYHVDALSKGTYYTVMGNDDANYFMSSGNKTYSQEDYLFPTWGSGIGKIQSWNGVTYFQRSKTNVYIPKISNSGFYIQLLVSLLPFIILIIIFYFMYRSFKKGRGGMGGFNPMGMKKTTTKPVISNSKFSDVAGYSEEKYELEEAIDYLKRPSAYNSMGVRLPKGLLFVGEPGTGKTLLARAAAGESNVPFFKINGSEFVELFVGIGAQRVRELFGAAKKHAPSILFIDEIDTIGRRRDGNYSGGNDEREQTLNQLLVELDGFTKNQNVIVIAATNRADVLDKALLRPGRFDRIIEFHNPTLFEREEILRLHSFNKNLDPDVSLKEVAARTPGFTGAQLENILNESALLSIRRKQKSIDTKCIDEAIDRSIGGLVKKSKKYIDRERRLVAYHESGHALCGLVLNNADKIQKITIIPRGKVGGYTLMTPKHETFFSTKTEILEKIIGLLGGRAAESFMFGDKEITSGAHNDIEKATNLARKMVTELGMTSLGLVKYDNLIDHSSVMPGGALVEPSDSIKFEIDKKIKSIIDDCYKKSLKLIEKHKDLLDLLAKALLIQETITEVEILEIKKTMKIPKHILDLKNGKEKTKEKKNPTTKKGKKITVKPT